ncbi:hypothetical protein GUJ93_ZPchr0011g28176 [Zizania palustris]|uniref:Uncharacterized protein n=1 Tax=Zizania palustris TaxID=103762 RepID=A0A8J5WGN2_ZIZPA|nr:hypothetical protein GUJ93_ZPchr0011g28176 [Zizania palustris]
MLLKIIKKLLISGLIPISRICSTAFGGAHQALIFTASLAVAGFVSAVQALHDGVFPHGVSTRKKGGTEIETGWQH